MNHLPLRTATALRYADGQRAHREEWLADEVPVAFVYNGRPHAVMMATPADLEDFAIGFTVCEDIAEPDQIDIVDLLHTPDGISLQMRIPQSRSDALDLRRRNLTGRTGCGLCGAESLAEAIRPVARVAPPQTLDCDALLEGFRRMSPMQALNQVSGGLHAAAVITAHGMSVREDVGRHNAVDKVIGAQLREGHRPHSLLVTSRASYEIVHKAAQAGVRVVAAISAPTALALRVATDAGIALVGFARGDRLTIYHQPPSTRLLSSGCTAMTS